MRLLSNLHVKGKPAVLPDHAIRRQSHYFIYRPRMCTSDLHYCSYFWHCMCCLLFVMELFVFSGSVAVTVPSCRSVICTAVSEYWSPVIM